MPDTILYISYNGIREPLVRSQVLNYLKGLHTEGYRFILLTFEKSLMSTEEQAELRHQLNTQDIEWVSLPYHNKPRLLGTVYDVWVGVRTALQLIKKHDVKLLHARSLVPALIARKVKQQVGLPFVNDIRGFWVDEKSYKGSLQTGSLLFLWGKQLEKESYLASDAIVSLSEAGMVEIRSWKLWENHKKPPMAVIPTCVELNAYQPRQQLDNEAPVFGYVGSLGRGYLGRELFRFFKCAMETYPHSRLLIVSRTDRELLQLWRTEAGIDEGKVEMISVTPNDVPNQVARMDVGLSFIEPHYSKKASCPTKLGEYLAAGIPVIANMGIGDTDKLLIETNTGILVEDFSVESTQRAIRQLLALMEDMPLPARCRQVAEHVFSLDKGIAAYAKLYRAILK